MAGINWEVREKMDSWLRAQNPIEVRARSVQSLTNEFGQGVTRSAMRRALIRVGLQEKSAADKKDYHRRDPNVKRRRSQTYINPEERLAALRDLASKGFSNKQIAVRLVLHPDTVTELARKNGITLPGREIAHRNISNDRVISQTVSELEAAAASLRSLGVSAIGVSPENAREWHNSLSTSMLAFSQLRRQLQEVFAASITTGDHNVKE